ncbi:hypothetical protein WG936_05555 [Corynebacterium sp. H127]|uniref:hypothetical protein n=1 Tax=Corynebacterium sp. H127 TaxID=3133418 RepID=UPI0030ADE2CE
METIDLTDLIGGSPLGKFLLVFLFLVFVFGIFSREKMAKLDGIWWFFGALARWLEDRKRRAIEADRSTTQGQIADLRQRVNEVSAQAAQDKKDLRAEIQELRDSERLQHQYIVYVIAWARDLEIWAADAGVTLPPPRFITYLEFREQWKTHTA